MQKYKHTQGLIVCPKQRFLYHLDMRWLLFLLPLFCEPSDQTTTTCNGMERLCELDIRQVTLAGTHNSGAGFDGRLKQFSASPVGRLGTRITQSSAISCFYRNQDKTFGQQLDFGVRYFDIDTCWQNWVKPHEPYACHGGAFGGSIRKMLQQIDDWMNKPEHSGEVIVIHFNRDYEEGRKRQIGNSIIRMLKEKWEPTSARKSAKKLTMQTQYVTLGAAVRANQRIYIIMHNELSGSTNLPWLSNQNSVGMTWVSKTWLSHVFNGMDELMNETRCKLEAYTSFVRYDLIFSSGLCVNDLAYWCNPYVKEGLEKCFKGTKKRGKTVNFVVVDYIDQQVIDAVKEQNEKNIVEYL